MASAIKLNLAPIIAASTARATKAPANALVTPAGQAIIAIKIIRNLGNLDNDDHRSFIIHLFSSIRGFGAMSVPFLGRNAT
jgi:hypothetical protein